MVSVWLDVQNAVASRQKVHFLLTGKETGYGEGFMEEIDQAELQRATSLGSESVSPVNDAGSQPGESGGPKLPGTEAAALPAVAGW